MWESKLSQTLRTNWWSSKQASAELLNVDRSTGEVTDIQLGNLASGVQFLEDIDDSREVGADVGVLNGHTWDKSTSDQGRKM